MNERGIIKINKENIILEFEVDNETYIAVEGDTDMEENTNILFFKKDSLDDSFDCVVSVDDEEKLIVVTRKFEEIINSEEDL